MKAVTANLLADGAVVYLGLDDQWTADLRAARRLAPGEAESALEAAKSRRTQIAGAYLIEVAESGAPAGREALRETIRSLGPTVRADLGRLVGAR